jgi:co-chaperonin GroES (HSP10)
MSLHLADATGKSAPQPQPDDQDSLTLSQRVQRDSGAKKMLQAEKERLKTAAIEGASQDVQFRDHEPSLGVTWKRHLFIDGKPCPFRIDPAPGTIVCLRKQKPQRSQSGVWLPENLQEPNSNRFAIVIECGQSYENEHGVMRKAPPLEPGDEIVTTKATMFEPDGKEWPIVIVPFEYLLGVVDRGEAKAGPKLVV